MTSRILSFVALAGMLVAAGCSGGGAGSGSGLGSGITPAAPTTGGGSTGGSSTATSGSGTSFSMSFLVPAADLTTTSSKSSSRNAQYISPGATGLQVLLATTAPTACTAAFAIGTATAPLALSPTPPTTVALPAGTCGANASTSAGVSGTGLLASSGFTDAGAPTQYTISTVPGSATITPVPGQIINITAQDSSTANAFTIQPGGVSGSAGTGFILVVKSPGTGKIYNTGALMTFVPGSSISSSYTYSFTPMSNTGGGVPAPSGQNGFYQANITFSNMSGGTYNVGVVLTDINNNFVLSDGQLNAAVVAAQGNTTIGPLNLRPDVAGVYIPAPTALAAATGGAAAGSFETTVFVTDEKGYVIPNQNSPLAPPEVPDNAPVITISPNGGPFTLGCFSSGTANCTDGTFTAGTNVANASITAAPNNVATTFISAGAGNAITVSTAAASPTNYSNVFGTLLQNYLLPTAPITLILNGNIAAASGGQVVTNANGIGNPLNAVCTGPGSGALKVTLASTSPAALVPVTGYTYTPGTNVPAAGPTTLASSSTVSIPTINCNPSISLPIN